MKIMNNSDYLEKLELKYNSQLEADPESNCFVLLAEVLIKQKKFDAALKVLVKGLRHNKHNTTARFLLGKLYFDRWMIDSAKKEFEKVIKLAPDNIAVSRILVQIYLSEGDTDSAHEIVKTLLFYHPDNAEIKNLIEDVKSGKQHMFLEEINTGDQELKIVNYDLSLRSDEQDSSEIVSKNLADLYYNQGHLSDSLEIYEKLLLKSPGDKVLMEKIEKIRSLEINSNG